MTTQQLASIGAIDALGEYRPSRQLAVGPDGAAFVAQDAAGRFVELRVLTSAAQDPARWTALRRQLRIAALLEHPGVLRIHSLALDAAQPHVALAVRLGSSLATVLARDGLEVAARLQLARSLAATLAEAHRLGLYHGGLGGSTVMVDAEGPWIDLGGTRTGAEPPGVLGGLRGPLAARLDALCRAPELPAGRTAAPSAEADAWALGVLLAALVAGEAVEPARIRDSGERVLQRLAPALRALLGRMVAEAPGARATVPELAEALDALHRVDPLVETDPEAVPETLDAFDIVAADLDEMEAELLAAPPMPTMITAPPDAGPEPAISSAAAVRRLAPGSFLGRFELLELIGAGGMGEVWRARDPADGAVVAIKVLHARFGSALDLERFRKEARLLEAVRSPWVANLVEHNEDRGVAYLVVEYVDGDSLAQVVAARGRLPERIAVRIVADLCRALADPHRRGIVHRDIKPENVLLARADTPPDADEDPLAHAPVKLIDFGIARHLEQSESLALTRTGTVMGSPHYMAPEQCGSGPKVGAAADVYALCATLFRLVAGRTVFVEVDDVIGLMIKHISEDPERLDAVAPGTSAELAELVARGLAKEPAARFGDAAELLRALEASAGGAASTIAAHPRLPDHDPADLLVDELVLELRATPLALWPWIADTDRLNIAVGLPPVSYATRDEDPPGLRRFDAQARIAGIPMAWTEHPFEWLEGRRYAVLREFASGPVRWYVHEVVLEPRGPSATRLRQTTRILPRNLIGRTVGVLQTRANRTAFERAYRRLERMLNGELRAGESLSAYAAPESMGRGAQRQLEAALGGLVEQGIEPDAVAALGAFIRHAPAEDLARIRPLALAARLGVDPDALVDACLVGASCGLFVLLWDILCPSCRVPSEVAESLQRLEEHGRCEVCRLDYEVDFARSVELIFRVHPSIRFSEVRTYCVGGPAHSPHVVAQLRLTPGERLALEVELPEGAYQLRSVQVPGALDLRVGWPAETTRLEATFTPGGPRCGVSAELAPGGQLLVLENALDDELLVRLERRASRIDALTAARACVRPRFRELFPSEVLRPGRLVAVQQVVLLVAHLGGAVGLFERLGDVAGFELVQAAHGLARRVVERSGGALVKTLPSGGFVAAFDTPTDALHAALALHPALAGDPETASLAFALALHRGPAVAATLGGHLDYFGRAANFVAQLPALTPPGTVLVSETIALEPALDALCAEHGLGREVVPLEGFGSHAWALRLARS